MTEEKQYKHLVRIASTDVDGKKTILYGLQKIKGVGLSFANAVCAATKINPHTKSGTLNEKQVSDLDKAIRNPAAFPKWLLNRRKDQDTGDDKHVILGDLQFAKENDIKLMKKIKSYKGTRHMFGLPARGQRTKSNFRRNKGKVMGVKKGSKRK